MINRTVTAVLDAPKNLVFDYLSKIENLPHWATEFAQELKYEDGKAKVVNGLGEFYFSISADAASGVIDMYAGPAEDQLALFPTRVVPLGKDTSAYLFTMFKCSRHQGCQTSCSSRSTSRCAASSTTSAATLPPRR